MIDASGICTKKVNPLTITKVIGSSFNVAPDQKLIADYTNVKNSFVNDLLAIGVITKDNMKVELERVTKVSHRTGQSYQTYVYK